jgi:hypothetical protein
VHFEAQRSYVEYNFMKLSHYENNCNFTKQHKSAPNMGVLQVPIKGYCRFLSWGTAGSYHGVLQVPIMGYCRFLLDKNSGTAKHKALLTKRTKQSSLPKHRVATVNKRLFFLTPATHKCLFREAAILDISVIKPDLDRRGLQTKCVHNMNIRHQIHPYPSAFIFF